MAKILVKMTLIAEKPIDEKTKSVRVFMETEEFGKEYANNVRIDLTLKDIFNLFIKQFMQDYEEWKKIPKTYEEEVEI